MAKFIRTSKICWEIRKGYPTTLLKSEKTVVCLRFNRRNKSLDDFQQKEKVEADLLVRSRSSAKKRENQKKSLETWGKIGTYTKKFCREG